MPPVQESELAASGVSRSISRVVKKLLCGKAPEVDEIGLEMLKALDVVGLSWLTRICNIAWTSGVVSRLV